MGRPDVPYDAGESITLPTDPASARRAREFVRRVVGRWKERAVEDAALLCVTELVANVSLHTCCPECILTVQDNDERLTIIVSDRAEEVPVMEPIAIDSEHGRGLRIVDALACEWGVTRHRGRGKSVWLRLSAS